MRSFVVTLFIALTLPLAFAYPYIGPLMYAWVSMMNPHRLTFGFAYDFPFAMIIAIVSLFMLIITKKRRGLPNNAIVWTYVIFLVWMSITSTTAIAPRELVWAQWLNNAKIHVMVFVTIMLIYEKKTLYRLIYVIVASIGYFGAKGGVFVLLTGGSYKVWGPPQSNVEENNALALGLVTLFPLLIWIFRQQSNKWVRLVLALCMGSIVFSILGSHSRGALLALVAMTFVLIMRSEKKVIYGSVLIAFIAIAVAFMPENWSSRMNTIKEHTDGSSQARLNTWRTIFNMSLDRPILGAGYRLDNPDIFARYSPIQGEPAYAPHSIYFQALGEHGYPGLVIFLLIPIFCIVRCRQIVKKYQDVPEAKWAVDLAKMFPVCFAGFGAGGAFLGLVHWDFIYYLVAIVIILSRMDAAGTITELHPSAATAEGGGWYSERARGAMTPADAALSAHDRPLRMR